MCFGDTKNTTGSNNNGQSDSTSSSDSSYDKDWTKNTTGTEDSTTQGESNTNTSYQNTSTTSGPAWLTDMAKNNLAYVQSLRDKGFQAYNGQQVANFSPQQLASFGLASDLGRSVNGGEIGNLLSHYASAGPQRVNSETIASRMSPYMNAYVGMALTPQLELQNQQFAQQNKDFNAQATGAGAFGDTGWGLGRSNLSQQQNMGRSGLIGNAYSTAFNTAIGAGAQDVATSMGAQNANANFAETALGRQLMGADKMFNLQTGAANLNNQFGQQQTARSQAELNAQYNQWKMAQDYQTMMAQLMNSSLDTATKGAGSTTTSSGTGRSSTQSSSNTKTNKTSTETGSESGTKNTTGSGSTTSSGTTQNNATDNSGYGWLASLFGSFFADGGTAPGGQPAIVGERGPELIVPNANSVVIPAEVLEAARMLRDKKLKKDAPQIQFGIAV